MSGVGEAANVGVAESGLYKKARLEAETEKTDNGITATCPDQAIMVT
jgi:hypothetical protein